VKYLKILKWILIIIALLIILSTVIVTPVAWIGLIIFLFGIYQMVQKSKGRVTFSKPGWIIVAGFIISFIMAMVFVKPVEPAKETITVPNEEKIQQNEVKKTDTDKQKEAERLAEEQKKKEEAERLAEEQKKKEEAARLAEEQKKKEEAARLAEEKKKKEEEAQRLAEEKRKKEEEARLAEEQRQKEEAERLAEEQKKQEEANNVYYKNCSAARAAGAAPVYQGEPGYGTHLDRDGDGIGCDR